MCFLGSTLNAYYVCSDFVLVPSMIHRLQNGGYQGCRCFHLWLLPSDGPWWMGQVWQQDWHQDQCLQEHCCVSSWDSLCLYNGDEACLSNQLSSFFVNTKRIQFDEDLFFGQPIHELGCLALNLILQIVHLLRTWHPMMICCFFVVACMSVNTMKNFLNSASVLGADQILALIVPFYWGLQL